MIFLASQADASALNLGKVSIKTINDVSQETYDVIAAYGNKSFTDDQIIAIDDFLTALRNHPAYSHITAFILPILSPETEPGDPNTDKEFTNNKVSYDLISKSNLPVVGYNGYVDKHGLRCYKKVGNPASVLFKNSSNVDINKKVITVGVSLTIPPLYNYAVIVNNGIQFGAADKASPARFDKKVSSDLEPIFTCGSRNDTEMHAVRNGELPIGISFNPEVYSEEIYSTNIFVVSNIRETSFPISMYFLCNGYMMTEDELMKMNNICLPLLQALW